MPFKPISLAGTGKPRIWSVSSNPFCPVVARTEALLISVSAAVRRLLVLDQLRRIVRRAERDIHHAPCFQGGRAFRPAPTDRRRRMAREFRSYGLCPSSWRSRLPTRDARSAAAARRAQSAAPCSRDRWCSCAPVALSAEAHRWTPEATPATPCSARCFRVAPIPVRLNEKALTAAPTSTRLLLFLKFTKRPQFTQSISD